MWWLPVPTMADAPWTAHSPGATSCSASSALPSRSMPRWAGQHLSARMKYGHMQMICLSAHMRQYGASNASGSSLDQSQGSPCCSTAAIPAILALMSHHQTSGGRGLAQIVQTVLEQLLLLLRRSLQTAMQLVTTRTNAFPT